MFNQGNYFYQEIKWSFTRFKVFCCPGDFLVFCPFQTEWEQLKKAKGNQLNCRFHFSVSPFFQQDCFEEKLQGFCQKRKLSTTLSQKKNEKKKRFKTMAHQSTCMKERCNFTEKS